MKRISAKKLKKLGGKMPFSTVTSAKKPLKKRARSKSERERIYGPPGFLDWIHEQSCIVCGYSPSECAHIKTGGTGRKDDWTRTVPLCGDRPVSFFGPAQLRGCHGELHDQGRVTFETLWNLDLEAEAAKCQERWLAHSGGKQ